MRPIPPTRCAAAGAGGITNNAINPRADKTTNFFMRIS
jgi:hypothetical protein